MATVGSLGAIKFNVSSNRVFTFSNYKRSGSAKVADHEIIAGKTNLEFTGLEPEQISFDVQLVSQLGISPETQYEKLCKMRDTGEVVNFMLGSKPVSNNKWIVVSAEQQVDHWKSRGKISVANVSITLREYPVDQTASNAAGNLPWSNIKSQITEIQDTVDAYRETALDYLDEIDDAIGGAL